MILITGGAVYGKLDDVKVITNRFKGGRMASLADELSKIYEVVYLTNKEGILPKNVNIKIVYHDGFYSYEKLVLEFAPKADAVVLGAAVCNLIPLNTIDGKFPSHNYNPGDIIDIPFTIAPRVIDQVKKVAPKTRLFGFKLLSNVDHDELISAAYDSVLASKATCIFANDLSDLDKKYAVTKEHSVIELNQLDLATFIGRAVDTIYFSTKSIKISDKFDNSDKNLKFAFDLFDHITEKYNVFRKCGKYMFGTCAVSTNKYNAFITTARGKESKDEMAYVAGCDYYQTVILTNSFFKEKATLNAPLLYNIFKNTKAKAIVHIHCKPEEFPNIKFEEKEYAFPGTTTDSFRNVATHFYIKNHGIFILLDEEGEPIE